MMKKLKNKLEHRQSKKGAYSIIIVILSLILVLSFVGYTDVMRKSYVMNEIQQRMDTSGLNALNSSIDIERLKYEELAIDENNKIDSQHNTAVLTNYKNKITEAYKKELYNNIRTSDLITKLEVKRVSVDFDNNIWGAGTSADTLPQITLDSVVAIKMKNSSQFDIMGTNKQEFYDARSGQNFSITVQGQAEDGYTELIIRSSTRIVYR